jgi:hypothetical protein
MIQYSISYLHPPPPIVSIDDRIANVEFLVFWALSRTRSLFIAFKHSLLFFAFALLCHGLLFALAYMRVINSLINPINKR